MTKTHQQTIAMIGLGNMGAAIADRFLDTGHTVHVLNGFAQANVDRAICNGAIAFDEPAKLLDASDCIFMCMRSADMVRKSFGSWLPFLKPRHLVVDFSTSTVETTKFILKAMADSGADFLDAPLSRTPEDARNGNLLLMVGGDRQVFESNRILLAQVASDIFYMGSLGSGHAAKLIYNALAIGFGCLLAETLKTGRAHGLEDDKLTSLLNAGPCFSPLMDSFTTALQTGPEALPFQLSDMSRQMNDFTEMQIQPESIYPVIRTLLFQACKAGHGNMMMSELVGLSSSSA